MKYVRKHMRINITFTCTCIVHTRSTAHLPVGITMHYKTLLTTSDGPEQNQHKQIIFEFSVYIYRPVGQGTTRAVSQVS